MGKNRVETGRGKRSGVVKQTKRRSRNTRGFYIALGVVIIAGLGALTWQATKPQSSSAGEYDPSLPAVQSNGYTIGSPNAPVQVTEYGDFECPVCGQFSSVIEPDIRSQLINTGRVYWRYIDYPLPMHRNTWNASRAAACADAQGKFWPMHDAIYQNQDRWNGEATHSPNKVLKDIAKQVGLDADTFDKCLDTKQTQAKVQAHMLLAQNAHIEGTPTFFINGKMVDHMPTYDEFKKLVDNAAAAAPVKPAGDTGTRTPAKTAR